MQEFDIDIEVSVDDYVAKSGHAAKLRDELARENSEPPELVDRACVVRYVSAQAGGDVNRDVERVLCTQMQASLDHPAFVGVRFEVFDGCIAVR